MSVCAWCMVDACAIGDNSGVCSPLYHYVESVGFDNSAYTHWAISAANTSVFLLDDFFPYYFC